MTKIMISALSFLDHSDKSAQGSFVVSFLIQENTCKEIIEISGARCVSLKESSMQMCNLLKYKVVA